MKSIHKRHVLAHQELQHTLTEQAVLKRMAREVTDPFVVKLWWSFHVSCSEEKKGSQGSETEALKPRAQNAH